MKKKFSNLCLPLAALLAAISLPPAAGAQQPALRAEILLGDLNCAACHDAPPAARDRLAPLRAPKIGINGAAIQPQWVRAFLDDPQKTRPGTPMPDMLNGLAGDERAAAVDALTHFIISFHTNTAQAIEASPDEIKRGGGLYHRTGCVACHEPFDPPPGAAADERTKTGIAKLAAASVPLGDITRKFAVPDLAEFLENPLRFHPSGRMPSLRLSGDEARAIAMYLLRTQAPPDGARSQGLKYEFFDEVIQDLHGFSRAKPGETGVASDVSLLVARPNENFSLRFSGSIAIPKDGEYKFTTKSDDGSWLLIDGKVVVNNEGMHATEEKSGTVKLAAGNHAFDCRFFQGSSESALEVFWEGPDLKRQEIPPSVFSRGSAPMKPAGAGEFVLDDAKAAKGRALFVSLNCVICHAQVGEAGLMAMKPLAELGASSNGGCLGVDPTRGLPKYHIADADREALRTALTAIAKPLPPPTPARQIEQTMTSLNCHACHVRDGRGGPQGYRKNYFVMKNGQPGNDAERLPPSLDGIGAKHDEAWIANILSQPQASRPEMATRMPSFGGDNTARLPEAFTKADAR